MEDDKKPWALISKVGDDGLCKELADIFKQHFRIISCEEFLQNPSLHGHKIQVLFNWKYCPAAEPSLLRLLPSLKVVSSGGVGVDHLDVPFITGLGVKVANTPGVVSNATADLAMGLLLASARNILDGHRISLDPQTFDIPRQMSGKEVTGATLGIIGMGDVGYKIAQRSKGFEMKILYHNRTRRSDKEEQAVGARYCERLDDLLRGSDFVMVAVKLTPHTTGMIGHRELSLMKRTATLVNISRGQVVDQDALLKALQSGTIHAAALDVTHPEPLPRDHPLLGLQNILITPHIGISTMSTARRMVKMMVENALAAVKGSPLPNEVTSDNSNHC